MGVSGCIQNSCMPDQKRSSKLYSHSSLPDYGTREFVFGKLDFDSTPLKFPD